MKIKKMILDESILDNFESEKLLGKWVDAPNIPNAQVFNPSDSFLDTYDDEFVDLEGEPSVNDHLETPIPGPQTGVAAGIATMLIDAMNDEWSTIDKYNSIVQTLRGTQEIVNPEGFITVIEEILAEENRHAGQLQELIRQVSPNAVEIDKGQREAHSQLNQFVGGRLQVQSWDAPQTNSVNPNEISELCSLSDIDDEM